MMRLQCPVCHKSFEIPSASPHAKIACPWCKNISPLSALLPTGSGVPQGLKIGTPAPASASPLTTNEWTAYPHPVPLDDSLLPNAHLPASPIPDLPPLDAATRSRIQKTGESEPFDASALQTLPDIPSPFPSLPEAPPLPPRSRHIPSQEALPSLSSSSSPSSPSYPTASRSSYGSDSSTPPRPSRPSSASNPAHASNPSHPTPPRSSPTSASSDALRSPRSPSPTSASADALRSSRTAAAASTLRSAPSSASVPTYEQLRTPSSAVLPSRSPTSASNPTVSRRTSASNPTVDRRSSAQLPSQEPSRGSAVFDQLIEDFVSKEKADDIIEIRYMIKHAGKDSTHGPFREEEILFMLEQRQVDPFDQVAKMKISSKGTRTEAWTLLKDSQDFKAIAGVFEQKPVHIDSLFATPESNPSRPDLPSLSSPPPGRSPSSSALAKPKTPIPWRRYLPLFGILALLLFGAFSLWFWKASEETRRLQARSKTADEEREIQTILRKGSLALYQRFAKAALSTFEQGVAPHEWPKIRFFWYAVDEYGVSPDSAASAPKILAALATKPPPSPLLPLLRTAQAVGLRHLQTLRDLHQSGAIQSLSSQDPEAGHLKGRAFELLGRTIDAETTYLALLAASPDLQRSRFRLFWLYLAQNKSLLAQQTLQRLALLEPPYIPALFEALQRSDSSPWLAQQAPRIRDHLSSQINERLPSHLRARWHVLHASFLWASGQKDLAWRDLERGIFLHPQESSYRKQRLLWLLQQQEIDKASLTLEEEIKNFPSDPDFFLLLFDLLRQQKRSSDLQARLAALKTLSEPSPAQAYARLVLEADLSAQAGKLDLASDLYKQAIALSLRTSRPDARLPYARLLLQRSRYAEASALAASLARDFPSSPDVALLLSLLAVHKGDFAHAKALLAPFKPSLSLPTPHRCPITQQLAFLAFKTHQCLELFSLPLEQCKTQYTLLQEAFCHLRSSNKDKASSLLKTLYSDLSHPSPLRLLLASLDALDDKDKAIETYKDLLSTPSSALPWIASELFSLLLDTKRASQASDLLKKLKKKKSLSTFLLNLETLRLEVARSKAPALRKLQRLQNDLTEPDERAAALRLHAQILASEDPSQALALLTRAVLLRPSDLHLLVERAALLSQLRQSSPCLASLQTFFTKAPLDHPSQIRANLLQGACSP